MGDVDRIRPIAPAVQPPSAAQRVAPATWDQRKPDREPHEDKIELHEDEPDAPTIETAETEEPPEHELDIAV